MFHDCIGQPLSPDEGPKFKSPNPLIIRELDLRKVIFVYKSPEFRDVLDKQAERGFGRIKWPEKPATEFTVECTLTKGVKDCNNLVKTWGKDMETGIIKIFEDLQVEVINVSQELWLKVLERVKQVKNTDPKKVAIIIEEGIFIIIIVGYKNMVEPLKDTLQRIISSLEAEIQKQKQYSMEKMVLKHHECLLLLFDHFKQASEKKFPGLKVTTNLEDKSVMLMGQFADVMQVKNSLDERCHQIRQAPARRISKNQREYLRRGNKEVKTKVAKILRAKDIVGCFECKEEVILYAFSDDKAVEAAHLLEDSIVEFPIEVPPDSTYLLSSDEWKRERKVIQSRKEFYGLLEVMTLSDQNKIIIVTFCDLVGLAKELVENFLRNNTLMSISMDVHPSIFKYLEIHHSKISEELSNQFKDQQVQIIEGKNKFTVKGTQTGLNQAKFEIDRLITRITWKKHTLEKPGITKHINSDIGAGYISRVQRQNKCYIQIGEKSETKVASPRSTAGGFSSDGNIVEHTTKSGISIKVHGGDLTTLLVDVIVSGANTDLQHEGGVAGVLVRTGGDEVQKECIEHVKRHGVLSEGEIFCSKAGRLSCKMIVHACCPTWKGGGSQESDRLTDCVQSALKETDKRNFRSVVFPALCTEMFGYPIKQATSVIVTAVKSYLKDNKVSSIKEIILCDMKEETVKDFTEALQQAYNGGVKNFSENIPQVPQPDVVKGSLNQAANQDFEFTAGNLSVKLIKGQIANAKTDVIVNSAPPQLNLRTGAVSASILKMGGDSIQQECQTKYPDGINHGEIAVTGGGNLGCKIVYHGALPYWDNDNGEPRKVLHTFVKSCLEESQKQNMASIAFPAMGTGNLGYPKDVVAEEMCQAVVNFSKENSNTSLKNVLFIVYEKDMPTTQAFETQIQKMAQKGTKGKGRHQWTEPKGTGSGKKCDDSHQRKPVIEDKRSSVTIVVYALDQNNIDAGIQSLEKLLDEDFLKKDFKDKVIHELTVNQINALQDLSVRYDVEVEIDRDQDKVVLFGQKDEISAAADTVHTILREAVHHVHSKAQAKLISDYVQWYYIDTDDKKELAEYPGHINLVIEKAYGNQEKEVKFSDADKKEYTIVFNYMEEFPSDDKSDVTTVTRRDKIQKSSFEPPKEWTDMKGEDNLEIVQVNAGTSEYSGVTDIFKQQVVQREIVKLERIQNKMLYQQYMVKKKLFDSQNPKETKNERKLWHGTAPEAVNSINSFGFNRSYCGKNATAYGEGVYFAVDAGYSARDTYSRRDNQGHKRMYLCNVLTGEYTLGQSGMRVPPQKPGQQSHILYDSVVDNNRSPEMFIIFNDTQAYPAYLITFK